MKKFKNKLVIAGPKVLRQAIAEELEDRGYKWTSFSKTDFDKYPILSTYYSGGPGKYIIGTLGNFDSEFPAYKEADYYLELPLDWNKALELAAELEVPEYVEWVSNIGCGNSGWMCEKEKFQKGKIFCTLTDNVPPSGLGENTNSWEKALTKDFYLQNFIPSTKEAYEEQNKPKFKKGDWLYFSYGGSYGLVKYKNPDGDVLATDEYYHLNKNNKLIGEGSSGYAINIKDCKLATPEQIEKVLCKVAEIKYPVGTRFKHEINFKSGEIKTLGNFELWINNKYKVGDSICFTTSEGLLYVRGKWAEIVEDKLEVNGYEVVRISNNFVRVGCQKFNKSYLKDLKEFLVIYGGTFFTKDNSIWTVDDIEDILSVFDE